jgi:SAM-dependent methyltransferase
VAEEKGKAQRSLEAAMDDLIPPQDLMFDGTTNAEDFKNVGEGFTWALLIGRAKLQPQERVLDLGCGVGQKARVLVKYLTGGTYDGLDIVPAGIRWCQEHYLPYPHFRFQLADLQSSHYNPNGRFKDTEYRLPYPDAAFDLVFLSSVFTHMLPGGVAHYLEEIARVLKPGGRCLSTYFLLNEHHRRRPPFADATIKFPFEAAGCRVRNKDNPSEAVAHPETKIKELHAAAGLRIAEVSYGFWCGGQDLLGALQDAIIAVKT